MEAVSSAHIKINKVLMILYVCVCVRTCVCLSVRHCAFLWDTQWKFFLTVRKTTTCWHGHYHKQAVVSVLDGVHSR